MNGPTVIVVFILSSIGYYKNVVLLGVFCGFFFSYIMGLFACFSTHIGNVQACSSEFSYDIFILRIILRIDQSTELIVIRFIKTYVFSFY